MQSSEKSSFELKLLLDPQARAEVWLSGTLQTVPHAQGSISKLQDTARVRSSATFLLAPLALRMRSV